MSGSKQDYALFVSGVGGKVYCESRATSTADTKISRVQLGSIDQVGSTGCTAYTDFSQVATSIQAGQQIPLTVSLGTCGATKNAIVKVFADWNQNGNFDDAGETLATSGVLANSAQFSTTLTIPTSVQNGQLIKFRLVATETDDAALVAACGLYGNGETQDYLLNVIQTINDVGAIALVSPLANFCGQTNTDVDVTVRLHNYGAADQLNVPVSVKITDANNMELTTLSGVVHKLLAFREGILTLQLPATSTLVAGQTYRFTITTGLNTDQNAANNSVTETRTTAPTPANGLFTATQCSADTVVSLRNIGSGTAFWYDAPLGGNLLAAGNLTTAPKLPPSGQFYATLNDFSGTIGPVNKAAFGGGSYYGAYAPAPLISTTVPILIESARLYIAAAGQLTFTVRKLDETVISSVTLDVSPTRNQSLTTVTSNGNLVDDPDDQGAIYPINLRIPEAGDYKITIDYSGGASTFRSNVSVSGLPYQLKTSTGTPIVTIKGALFNSGTTIDTLTTAWYYFYNIKVRSLDCPSLQRTVVTPITGTSPTVSVTPGGSASICQGSSLTLEAITTGTGLAYQWYRNDALLTAATSSTLPVTTVGKYSVQVANTCFARSSVVTVSVNTPQNPVIITNGFTLTSNATSNIQWLMDGVPIAGATGTTYTVVKSGRYSVKGSVNGCGAGISNEVVLTILATEPVLSDDDLLVYPNPVTRQLTVSVAVSSSLSKPPALRLTDIQGRTIRNATLQPDGKNYSTVVDVGNLPGGTFFVVVEDERTQNVRVKRIHKQ